MSSAVEGVHSSRPAEGRPAAAPRALVVGVLADMLEENWPSMDLVADALVRELPRQQRVARDAAAGASRLSCR